MAGVAHAAGEARGSRDSRLRWRGLATALAVTVPLDAQFRKGIFSEGTEITLYPLAPTAVLLPRGSVRVEVKNGSGAGARSLERVQERLARQLADNDERL